MKTLMLLLAQYDGVAVVPIEHVCRDYFRHLTPDQLARKISRGEIELPMVRMEKSQKTAKGFHLQDLADYIDRLAQEAREELHSIVRT